jgi:hypothetical protein
MKSTSNYLHDEDLCNRSRLLLAYIVRTTNLFKITKDLHFNVSLFACFIDYYFHA